MANMVLEFILVCNQRSPLSPTAFSTSIVLVSLTSSCTHWKVFTIVRNVVALPPHVLVYYTSSAHFAVELYGDPYSKNQVNTFAKCVLTTL
jgi:hypothetical protein